MNNNLAKSCPHTIPRGFTLIELMVAIAVLAILLTLAAPSVQKIIRDSRVTSQTNEVIALINLTRNQAIREGIDDNDDREAVLRIGGVDGGWGAEVFVSGTVTDDPNCDGEGVIRCSENSNVSLSATNNRLSFESRGYLRKDSFTPEIVCLKHSGTCDGDRQHVQIEILASGQIETRPLQCGDPCPTG